ncbi:hypothetical protein ES703_17391 [subsurface metagenome]
MMVLAAPAHAWVAEPTEETGYYYMYDDQSDPPFTEPELPPLPSYDSIWQDPDAEKFCTYSDWPHIYEIEDSFWYYGVWYVPGDTLYIPADGWVSFDNASVESFPNPPIDDPPFPVTDNPNELIAPLWQDNNCTQTPDPSVTNRIYYLYDAGSNRLTVQWYDIQGHATGNVYDYEVVLHLGGQDKLVTNRDSEVVFSYHFIEFLYNTSSAGWDADSWHDPPAVGFEDQDGTHGIYYQGDLADGRVIRMGYKKAIDHDVAADEIIAPATIVEPNTDVDPITVIGNYGNYAETCDVILNIYDDEETRVYHNVMTLFDGMDFGVDTLGPSEWPLWTPGGPVEHYIAELIVSLNGDQCPANDTLIKHVWTSAGVTETPPPVDFELKINDMHTIEFSVPYTMRTELAIYDVNGNKIRALTNKTYPAGTHTLYWDGCDAKGRKIAQGVYLVRMEADGRRTTRKVVVY